MKRWRLSSFFRRLMAAVLGLVGVALIVAGLVESAIHEVGTKAILYHFAGLAVFGLVIVFWSVTTENY